MKANVRSATMFVLAFVLLPTNSSPSPAASVDASAVLEVGTPFAPAPSEGLYSPDSAHIWNRVHRVFHVRLAADGREYGENELDPLLWHETTHLLTGVSHRRAIAVLDEFLSSRAERLITDPLKRVVFQHDLWKVFDWLAIDHEHAIARRALATRVAKVMRRVALTRDQIARLPDTYAAAVRSRTFPIHHDSTHADSAFLPANLFDANGPWVSLSSDESPFAERHAELLSQSAFSVFLNVPGGRAATLRYLRALWEFTEPYIEERPFPSEREHRAALNPGLPQLPNGTQLALVRKMLLVDDSGVVIPSAITESVQIRVMRARPTATTSTLNQHFFEFQLARRRLFADQSGGLRVVERNERGFATFSSHGFDPIEQRHNPLTHSILDSCIACHAPLGGTALSALGSAGRLLRPNQFLRQQDPLSELHLAAFAKMRRYEFGLLRAYWHMNAP